MVGPSIGAILQGTSLCSRTAGWPVLRYRLPPRPRLPEHRSGRWQGRGFRRPGTACRWPGAQPQVGVPGGADGHDFCTERGSWAVLMLFQF